MVTLAYKSISEYKFLFDRLEGVYGYGYRPHIGDNNLLDLTVYVKNTAGNYADIVVGYCRVNDKDIAMDVLHTFAFPSS